MGKRELIIGGLLLSLAVIVGLTRIKPAQRFQREQNKPGEVYTNTEYGFSVITPGEWSYKTSQEKVGNAVLVIELISADKRTRVPISIEEKSWDLVKSEARKNFKSEAIRETVFAGQPAVSIVIEKEKNPSYGFRIQLPNRKDTTLLGMATSLKRETLANFHHSVETVLNSLKFY